LSLKSEMLRGVISVGVSLFVWAFGWFLYAQTNPMSPVNFQNILVALIGLTIAVGFGLRRSLFSRMRRETSEPKSTYEVEVKTPQPNVSDEIARLQKSVSEINTKISDIHAFKSIMEAAPLSRLRDLEIKYTQLEKSVGDLSITRTIVEEHKPKTDEHKVDAKEEKTRA
jgi:hypothetical protein